MSWFDEDIAKRLANAGIAYVGISIDGIETFNDAYRGLRGGFGAALRGLRNAKAAGMKTGLRIDALETQTSTSSKQWSMLRLDAHVNRFYVSHLVYSGRGYKVAHEDLSRQQQRSTLTWLFEKGPVSLIESDSDMKIVTGSNGL